MHPVQLEFSQSSHSHQYPMTLCTACWNQIQFDHVDCFSGVEHDLFELTAHDSRQVLAWNSSTADMVSDSAIQGGNISLQTPCYIWTTFGLSLIRSSLKAILDPKQVSFLFFPPPTPWLFVKTENWTTTDLCLSFRSAVEIVQLLVIQLGTLSCNFFSWEVW